VKKSILVGIDLGSSNVKTVLFDCELREIASAKEEYNTIIPKPGWSEYDPSEWWKGVIKTFKVALEKSGIEPRNIVGIGVSSLGCCPVPMDKTGNTVYNGIPWSDHRAQHEVDYLKKYCAELIYKKCKNVPTTLNSAPHLMWIKNNEKEVYKKIFKYTEPSGFIVQKFTGDFTMDYSFASSEDFGFDINILNWSEELINAMGLDINIFPKLHHNMDCIGELSEKSSKELNILPGIKIFAGGIDITASTVGVGVINSGQGHYSMGSGANMMVMTDNQEISSPNLLSIFHAKGPELRMLDGVQGSIGYSVRWFRDNFSGLENISSKLLSNSVNSFELMDLEASKTKPGAGGIIYIPYLFGKFHPVLNPNARGIFFGLNSLTTRSQIFRAMLEGCSFDMYQNLNSCKKLGLKVKEIIVSGGPAISSPWCQIMADVSNTKIITVKVSEASPLGNAIIAGIGCGLFKDLDEVRNKFIIEDKIYEPNHKNHELYHELFGIYEQIYQKLLTTFDSLEVISKKFSL